MVPKTFATGSRFLSTRLAATQPVQFGIELPIEVCNNVCEQYSALPVRAWRLHLQEHECSERSCYMASQRYGILLMLLCLWHVPITGHTDQKVGMREVAVVDKTEPGSPLQVS